jgi:D-alanyl-D-alanine carboxypeptidase (penicillin-binding protein 5/6)
VLFKPPFRAIFPALPVHYVIESPNGLGKSVAASIHLAGRYARRSNRMARLVSPMLRRAALSAATAAAVMAAALQPGTAQAPKKDDTFQTAAPYAILIDADTNTVLFEKNADKLNPPASMSKLMTIEVVLHAIKEGRLKIDDELTVSEYAWRKGGAPSGGSAMFAAINSKVKVDALLRGVMIQSGNDACIAFAEGLAGSEGAFAEMMNKRAREIGLTQSRFANPTGLHDPEHMMTMRELAKLAQHIIKTYPEYYKIYGERDFTWNKVRQQNRNPLLTMGIGADGMKTGFTKEAGYGLVGSAVQNGLRLIVVVNGFKSMKDRADEARKLLEWGFRGFEARPLFAESETVGEAKLYGGAKGRVPLLATQAIRLLVPRNATEKLSAKVVYSGPVRAPVAKGQPIGTLKVSRGENVVLEVALHAGEDVGTGNLTQRAFDAVGELVINVFRAGVDRM